MGAVEIALRRIYGIHGVALEVIASEPAALGAIDLRLRGFDGGHGVVPAGEVTVEFRSAAGPVTRPESDAFAELRPVYDTPFGTLHYAPETDLLIGTLGGVRFRCHANAGQCAITARAFTRRDLYLATHPLTTIALMELLERRGLYSLHAACVAPRGDRGVLIAGASGAGKSTLTVALAHAGVPFLSDDVVFLRQDPSAPGIHALGFADTIGVTGYAAARFPDLREHLGEHPPDDGFPKRLVRVEHLFGMTVLPACMPGALVFPSVAPGERSRVQPLSSGEALLRLVPDVLLTEPAATQAHLRAIAALLAQVECYELRSGADIERAAELVCALV